MSGDCWAAAMGASVTSRRELAQRWRRDTLSLVMLRSVNRELGRNRGRWSVQIGSKTLSIAMRVTGVWHGRRDRERGRAKSSLPARGDLVFPPNRDGSRHHTG